MCYFLGTFSAKIDSEWSLHRELISDNSLLIFIPSKKIFLSRELTTHRGEGFLNHIPETKDTKKSPISTD
jgi:hypothetical protein